MHSKDIDPEILTKAKVWATAPCFDAATRKEIGDLLERKDYAELTERFYRNLEFGTGGMRGIMGAGIGRMNLYSIRRATAALAQHLKSVHGSNADMTVALTYDSRHNSPTFAQAAAGSLAAVGIKVLMTEEMRPVPMLSFMVRQYACKAGICITASHNPPAYNGFKVYWQTGGQLVPPDDQAIMDIYESLDNYGAHPTMDFAQARETGLIQMIGAELDDAYLDRVAELSNRYGGRDGFKIVYTPLHGTGITMLPRALARFGFEDVQIVEEQAVPDGSFPTVSSPNPEDPRALDLALALAKSCNADIVMGTDPDSDRIGLIVREGKEWTYFNGNQLGCLLTEYVLSSLKESDKLPKNALTIKTIVTTELQAEIARFYGAVCEETLTGFKWICKRIEEYTSGVRKPPKQFVCGGEESYGFLAGDFVRDKDAIIACSIAAEMVAVYKSRGLTPSMVLDQVFKRHKIYHESLYTLTLPGKTGAEEIQRMMIKLRTTPPLEIGGFAVLQIKDVLHGTAMTRSDEQWKTSGRLGHPSSDVLQFEIEGGRISMRPSGTEPKIKFYTSAWAQAPADEAAFPKAKTAVAKRCAAIEDAFIALMK